MMMIELVNGADLRGLDLAMRPVLIHAGAWRKQAGFRTLIVTCGLNGEHSPGSLHYYGRAVDFRTYDTDDAGRAMAEYLVERLPRDYDVVRHTSHLHVEYDPK